MKIQKKSIVLALIGMILGMATMPSLFSLRANAMVNPTITLSTEDNSDYDSIIRWVNNVNKELDDTSLQSNVKSDFVESGDISHFKFLDIEEDSRNNKQISVVIRKIGDKDSTGDYVAGYSDLDTNSKNKVLTVTFSLLDEDVSISRTSKVKIYNFIYNSDESTASMVKQLSTDTRADFYRAYSALSNLKILKAVSFILGVISLGVFMLLAITLVLDLAYINIPFFQVFCMDNKLPDGINKGKKSLGEQIISYEARQAVDLGEASLKSDSMLKSKSPIMFYLSSKTKQMAALFICLLYLVSGNIYSLLAQFMDLFRGFLGI